MRTDLFQFSLENTKSLEKFSLCALVSSAGDVWFEDVVRDRIRDGMCGLLIICGTGRVMEGMRQYFDAYTWTEQYGWKQKKELTSDDKEG